MEIGEEVALLEILRDFVHQKTSTSGDFTHSDGSVKKMWRMHITGRICKKRIYKCEFVDVMCLELVLNNAIDVINLTSSSAKYVFRYK